MAVIVATPVQDVDLDGIVATPFAVPASTDQLAVPPGTILRVINGNAAPTVVTIISPGTVAGQTIGEQTKSVTNATTQNFAVPRGFPWENPDGYVYYQFSVTATVTAEVLRVL